MDDDVVLDTTMAAALARSAELNSRFPEPGNLEEERQRDQAFAPAWAAGAPEVASVEPYSVPTESGYQSALLVRPPGVIRPPLMMLIHGGGWNKGSIAQTIWHQNALCVASGHAVLSVSYRLAPEHPFPGGLHDVEAAYEWGLSNRERLGMSSAIPAIGGASAGANLAITTSLLRRQLGRSLPSSLVLFYGVFGGDIDTTSYHAFGDGRFGLSRARMANSFDAYVGVQGDRNNPLVAPLNADLAGLPPVWLASAEIDVLRDDTLQMAERLKMARVAHMLVRGHGLVHGYCSRGNMVPLAAKIVRDAGDYLAALAKE